MAVICFMLSVAAFLSGNQQYSGLGHGRDVQVLLYHLWSRHNQTWSFVLQITWWCVDIKTWLHVNRTQRNDTICRSVGDTEDMTWHRHRRKSGSNWLAELHGRKDQMQIRHWQEQHLLQIQSRWTGSRWMKHLDLKLFQISHGIWIFCNGVAHEFAEDGIWWADREKCEATMKH